MTGHEKRVNSGRVQKKSGTDFTFKTLDQIDFSANAPPPKSAVFADAGDDQTVIPNLKIMLLRYGVAQVQ